jgi:hypothetical protein
MATPNRDIQETDALHHTAHIKGLLDELARHCREDVSKVAEPKAQALFETTAEVLIGLRTAYDHYERGEEEGMRR